MDARDLLPGLGSVAAFAFAIVSVMKPRADLVLENLALRQQLAVLKRKQTRPRIERFDRLFWLLLRRLWSGWAHVLALVEPATVVRWHRLGFRLFWRRKSQKRAGGRSAISREIRELIRRMASENATWGAPRIHAELLKLGFKVSERTVSRFIPKRPAPPDATKRWIAFLRNHAGEIAAMDFFVVPTATFRVLYVWFAIRHGRRELAHFAVTEHPHAAWVAQQIRDAFPFDSAPRHLIFDGDKCFGSEVKRTIRNLGTKPKGIAPRCPWQNGVTERWVGSCRRELIDHVVPLGAAHLRRLLRSYVEYYNGDRCHLSLDKDAPNKRRVTPRPSPTAELRSLPRVGGLHHKYEWRAAA